MKINEVAVYVGPTRPRLGLTEGAYTHNQYLTEQQLLENFLDSIKQYIGSKADQTIANVQNTITNYKEAGLLIKEILENDELFEVVEVQINKLLRMGIQELRDNQEQNKFLKLAWTKLTPMFNRVRTASGWLGVIGKLIFIGILKFLNQGLEKIVSDAVVDDMYDKVAYFVGNIIKRTEQITMPWFVKTLQAFKTLDEYFFETLSYIRQKLRSVQIKTTGEQVTEGPLAKAVGTAAVAGAVGLAGNGAYQTYQNLSNIDTTQPAKVAQAPAQAKQDLSTIQAKAQKSAEKPETKAQKSAENDMEYTPITGKKNELILAKVAQQHGITGVELAAFMAQMAHESINFGDMVENNPDIKRYAKIKSLGNKNMNDAERFIGRGFIQLTGRWNYEYFGKKLGMDLTSTWSAAHQAADPVVAAKIAVAFWKTRVQPNVNDFANVEEVTKPINPNLNGLEDREKKFNWIAGHMGIDV